jgi:hypothetical protein
MATPAFVPTAVTASQSEVPANAPFTDEQIAQRAYEIFEREGSVHGNNEQHWFRAIEELTAEAQQLKPTGNEV